MHKLYKEIDNSGYEDMPKEIYARRLRHVEKLKKEELDRIKSKVTRSWIFMTK